MAGPHSECILVLRFKLLPCQQALAGHDKEEHGR